MNVSRKAGQEADRWNSLNQDAVYQRVCQNMARQFELAITMSEFIENLGNEPSVLALALKRFWESLRKSPVCTPIQQ